MADIKINLGATAPSGNQTAAQPTVSAPPSPDQEEESFQNIFNQKTAQTKDPKLLETIVSEKSTAAKVKPILGSAPTLQKTLQQEKEYELRKKVRLVQGVLLLVFLLTIGMAFYFYSELSPGFNLFGANTTAKLTDVNKNLRSLQTQLNKYRYLAAQLDLNRFSYVSDQFLDKASQLNDPEVPANVKLELQTEIVEAQSELPIILQRIRENLTQDIVITTTRSEAEPELTADQIRQQFEEDLRNALREERSSIAAASETQNLEDLKLYDNTLKLVGNTALLNTVKNVSVESFQKDLEDYTSTQDQNKRKNLQTLIASILSSTKSDLSTIGALKNTRIDWSTIIKQLETVTAERDPNFGKGVFETLGGILYTGYEFDANADKIVLSGVTKTNDATNFALISLLVDDLEGSEHFKDVEMRSFSKTGTAQEGYVANFKIDLGLESEDDSNKNEPISLVKRSVSAKSGIKRIIDLSNR